MNNKMRTTKSKEKKFIANEIQENEEYSIDDFDEYNQRVRQLQAANAFYSNQRSTMDKIIARLYLGNDVVAQNLSLLKEKKITHILNLTTNVPNKFEPDIVYKKIIMFDTESQNIRQHFDESFQFIDESLRNKNNAVLVHCNAGISRSSSFVIAYLIQKKLFKSYKDALAHVRKCRPIVAPNKGFEKQLIKLEKSNRLLNKNSCSLM
jgi:atypical dual specificity phosphatase